MASLNKYSQQGATLVVVLMLLLIMMILGLSIASRTTARAQVANNSVLQAQAEQAAATGADVLLTVLNSSTVTIPPCDKSYVDQYSANIGTTSSDNNDYRKIKLKWYACEPVATPTCTDGNGCKAYVITGVACFNNGSITDTNTKEGCTVRRYLQGYATKKS